MEGRTREDIEFFIDMMKDSIDNAERIFTKGRCLQFAVMLDATFDGEVYYNGDHFIFYYKGRGWDITGEVDITGYQPAIHSHSLAQLIMMYENSKGDPGT